MTTFQPCKLYQIEHIFISINEVQNLITLPVIICLGKDKQQISHSRTELFPDPGLLLLNLSATSADL